MIYAPIYVDGKFIGDAGVTDTTELAEHHGKELAYQVQKVFAQWVKDRREEKKS